MHREAAHLVSGIDGKAMLDRARETLEIESSAIRGLMDRLDGGFVQACELIINCTGRIVLTGIGKSGSIGRKLSGTFSSTGTPALFLHPAEGVHGDLGALTRDDILIILSYSGETDELLSIMPVVSRIGAKAVAVVGNTTSSLARYAEVVLDISVEREACPYNLAPTASTTAMLALGDALALAVMEARHFGQDDFAIYHPAGSLGRKLMRVVDVMRSNDSVAIVKEDMSVRDVLFAITRAGAGAAIITSANGRLAGIITDGDIRRRLLRDEALLQRTAAEVMNRSPKTISAEVLATEGLLMMEDLKIGELPVLWDGKPIGMLMMKDIVKAGIVT